MDRFRIESEVDEATIGPFSHPPISNGPADPDEPIVAASRRDRPVNRLSTAAIVNLHEFMVNQGRLVEVNIVTGCSTFNRVALLSRYRNAGSSSSAQLTVPGGSPAEEELDGYNEELYNAWEALDASERSPRPPAIHPSQREKAHLLNVAHLEWRFNHRFPETNECKFLLYGFECSHAAEGYDLFPWPPREGDNLAVFPGNIAMPGWRVEVSELESYRVNDARRKLCQEFGLNWRRPDGSLIMENDYVGPTMCIHQAWGFPCYSPRPTFQPVAQLVVPVRQRIRRSSRLRLQAAPVAQPGAQLLQVEEEEDEV